MTSMTEGSGGPSPWSLWSEGSFACIASTNSAFSIGSLNSVGSMLSVGSAGSIASIGSAGSIGSALSAGSIGSVMAAGGFGSLADRPTGAARAIGAVVGGAAISLVAIALWRRGTAA